MTTVTAGSVVTSLLCNHSTLPRGVLMSFQVISGGALWLYEWMKSIRSISQPIDRSINQSVDHERKSYKKWATISIPIFVALITGLGNHTARKPAVRTVLLRTVFLATKLATHLWNNLCERREFTLLSIKINDRFSFLSLILFSKRIKNVSLCFCRVREFETLGRRRGYSNTWLCFREF